MSFKFENLNVWKQSRKLVKEVYIVTSSFPLKERFGLTDQLRRAAVSIVLNIAEGCNRKSDKDFIRYLRMSIGSINELVTGLFIARDLKYLNKKNFDHLYKELNVLIKRNNALISSIK